jgi:hypothetical protein
MDSDEIPLVVNGFRNVGQSFAHGMVLLSTEQYAAWVWLFEASTRFRRRRFPSSAIR